MPTVTPLSAVGITRYHRPGADYAKLRNSFLRDAAVPLAAFRVGAYILSHADGFVQTQSEIARATRLCVTTVRKALDDLRAARYLVSRRVRESGRWVGTAYAVSDVRFTDEELAALSPPGTHSVHSESAPPKKKITSKKISATPSGGAERRNPKASKGTAMRPGPEPQSALFDLDSPTRPPAIPAPSAQRVVAAYVTAYRVAYGAEPAGQAVGRIGREAKRILDGGRATETELTAAASALGCSVYTNLQVELNKIRRPRKSTGMAPPIPAGDPTWSTGAAATKAQAELLAAGDPEIAALLAGVA